MNFATKLDTERPSRSWIMKTGAALGPGVYGTLREARLVLGNEITARIDALRVARIAALHTRERDLATEPAADTTVGEQMAEIGRQVNAGASGGPKEAA